MQTDDLKKLTEEVIASGVFKFKVEPVVTLCAVGSFTHGHAYMIRIMWGINEAGEEMDEGGEGIEFFIPVNIKDEDLREAIILKIDKDLGGIYEYSKELYYHIIQ